MQKQWRINDADTKLQDTLSNALGIAPIIAQLLINRGITNAGEARDFLSADLGGLHDPFLLKNMDIAVLRIRKAKTGKERVLVFGDYDVDGVTSSALLNSVLTQLGIEVIHYIPHRFHHGYGLNEEVAEFAR